MKALFRPARSQEWWVNLTKTLVQTAVFWSVLLWLVPTLIVAAESTVGLFGVGFQPRPAVGLILLVSASVAGLWAAWTMSVVGVGTPLPLDTAQKLVTTGPYALVRNPMAVAGLLQGLGVGLLLGSWSVVAYVVAGGLLWHFVVRPIEESDLERRFGAAYLHYREGVRLWLPWRRGA